MTRWARKGPANKKKPLPVTNWEDMISDFSKAKNSAKRTGCSENASVAKNKPNTLTRNTESESDMKLSDKNQDDVKIIPDKKPLKDTKGKQQKRKVSTSDLCSAEVKDTEPDKKKAKVSHSSGSLNLFGSDLATALESQVDDSVEKTQKKEKEEEDMITDLARKTERSMKRRLKRIEQRQQQKVCFKCRQPGHECVNCPELEKLEFGVDICFRCGSGEHKISQCKSKKVASGKFPFANCFICGEAGHLSRSCPENRNGVYPNGGCCLSCGSIYHFKRDCPELQKNKGVKILSLKTVDECRTLDEEPTIIVTQETEKAKEPQRKKTKVVKF